MGSTRIPLLPAVLFGILAWSGCAPPTDEAPRAEPAAQPSAFHEQHHHRSAGRDETAGPNDSHARRSREEHANTNREPAAALAPEKVAKVLRYIDEHNRAPEGYVGGREFHNLGRDGEQALPRKDGNGRSITYQEWDVNPKVSGVNRGAERLITGSDGSAYYTTDHYRTFKKVR